MHTNNRYDDFQNMKFGNSYSQGNTDSINIKMLETIKVMEEKF